MLAWLAAILFGLAAISGAEGTSAGSWLSWPVLACTGMILLAADQALCRTRKVKDSSEERRPG